jgi:beta-lactamase superfamily II metal-dependent hydrolase
MIVSARTSNNQLFPSATTRASAERLGITMLTTDHNGTVTVIGENGGFEIKTSAKKE